MATKVHMEALSPTMEEGQVVRWLKSEGDAVEEGEILAEIETDKATMELVARGGGVLRKQLVAEGQTAPVGAVIGVIAAEDEDIAGILQEAPTSGGEPTHAAPAEGAVAEGRRPDQGAGEDARAAEAAEEEGAGGEEGAGDVQRAAGDLAGSGKSERAQSTTGVQAAAEAPTGRTPAPGQEQKTERRAEGTPTDGRGEASRPDGRVKASPLARRLAAEAGLELRNVEGSGPGGRITRRDIEAAAGSAGAPPAAPPEPARRAEGAPAKERPQPALREAAERPEVEEIPVSQMRKTIAKRLVTSIGPIPTFYLTTEADMTAVLASRERLNTRMGAEGGKASINDFIIRAVAEALRRHPEVNASWAETVVRRFGRVHIGVAVAVEDGLITPIVRDADRKGIAQIAREVRELAERARARKLQPDEYTGATFSVSNLGMFGIDEFTAIINPPEAAILAVGRVEERAMVKDGEVIVRPRMRITMSCDHRVIDGATGARFLQTVTTFLEDPVLMLA